MEYRYFIKQIDVNEPVEKIFDWHEKVGAFERLTPPWMRLKNIQKSGNGIETGAKVSMDISFAGIPFPIRAEHIAYEKNDFFKDRLYGGIFSKWEHTHKFLPLGIFNIGEHSTVSNIKTLPLNSKALPSKNFGLSRLEDRIDYALPFHIPDNWHNFIKEELYRLFNYRHTVMVNDLKRHKIFEQNYKTSQFINNSELDHKIDSQIQKNLQIPKTLTILISGASGPVGNALIPFLTTGGHRVIKLVRRRAKTKNISNTENIEEIEWNPYTGELDLEEAIEKISIKDEIKSSKEEKSGKGRAIDNRSEKCKIDVVINLNGYHIGSGRWTRQTKDIIIKSRNLSTTLLAEKIASLPQNIRPDLFISASATGFYGDCGDACLDENSCSGDLFISQVCREWENCAKKAEDAGVRTVFARMGVVLTPAGGALERLLPGFMAGLGAKIGNGKQYMSWISMDDLIYSLHHIIVSSSISNSSISGAVNLISPNPVTNQEFTQTLAKVLSRPAPFTLPASLIKMVWGEMGQEVLLSSTRVMPERLLESGFKFSYPTLEEALRHLVGKKAYFFNKTD
ncbi:MAG: TIGR01777 family protein [Desulfamplus sp.]|nr:TIGR01777 family protein [Desulfamplus sp.]